MSDNKAKISPPWEVLNLVATHLDPKTLAIAACVSKSWSICMSTDHLWRPICSSLYPSLSNLHPAVSFRKLHNLGKLSDVRRLQKPSKPNLSLDDVIFAVDLSQNDVCLCTTVKSGNELVVDKNGLFRFDIEVKEESVVVGEALDTMKITWNVVLKGFKSVFKMMECRGKGNFVLGLEGWFSKELPSSGCCCCSSSGAASGLVADLRLGLKETSGGRMVVEKVSVGVLSIVSWRYVCVDDALRYLQYFLLPSHL